MLKMVAVDLTFLYEITEGHLSGVPPDVDLTPQKNKRRIFKILNDFLSTNLVSSQSLQVMGRKTSSSSVLLSGLGTGVLPYSTKHTSTASSGQLMSTQACLEIKTKTIILYSLLRSLVDTENR